MCSAKTFSPPLLMGLKETRRGRGGQGVPQENMSRLFVPRDAACSGKLFVFVSSMSCRFPYLVSPSLSLTLHLSSAFQN